MESPAIDGDPGAHRYRFGVRAKALSGLAVLVAALLVISATLVAESWRSLRIASRAEAGNVIAGELIRAMTGLAAERGITNGILTDAEPADSLNLARIEERRAGSDAILGLAFRRLRENVGALSAKTIADLKSATQRVEALRGQVDAQIRLPARGRDPAVAAAWRPAVSGLLEVLRAAIDELSAPATTPDVELQAVLEAQITAFDLRNASGERAALLSGVLGARRPIDLSEAVLLGSRQEAAQLHWNRIRRLAGGVMDRRLDQMLFRLQRGFFDRYLSFLDRITAAGIAGEDYPVDLPEFYDETNAAVAGLDDLVLLTHTLSTERLAARVGAAEMRLVSSLAAAVACLAVAGFSVFMFSRRVLRPIEQITGAMRRLAAGTAVDPDLPVGQRDEIGEMSRAIAAFRDTIIASEVALLDAERFTRQTIDALPSYIAVLDDSGLIIAANKSWRRFGGDGTGLRLAHEGQNYLAICDRSAAAGDDISAAIASGIRRLLAGIDSEFEAEYPARGPAGKSWYRLRVTRFEVPGPVRLVVAHEDITGRKLAEEGLRDRNRLLELAEQMSSTGHWRFELATSSLRWSSEIYRIYGRSPEDYVPDLKSALAAYHPEDRETFTAVATEAIRTGKGFTLDLRLFRSDGQLRAVEVMAGCETGEDGRVVALFGVFRDISDRKKIEERLADVNVELERRVAAQTAELSAREAYLRGILDNVAEIVMTIDADHRIESFNPAAERAFGYEAAEVIGRGVDMLSDGSGPQPDRGISRFLTPAAGGSGTLETRELVTRRKDGVPMPVELTVAEMEIGGRRRFIAAMRDITERKGVERELQERATLLHRAQDLAGIGHWNWRRERQTGEWHTGMAYSRSVSALFGVEPAELAVDDDTYIARFVHPEDREALAIAFRDHKARRRERRPLEYRIVRPDGSVRHIREVTEYVPPEDEDPGEVLGTIQDITERKQAELALRASEARLRAIFDHAPVTISLRDIDGRYVMVNRRFQEIFGLPEEEIIGRRPQQFYPARFIDEIARAIEQVRRTKSTVISEEGAPTIFGERRYLTTRFPIIDDIGTLSGIGSISVDVTEQRAAEAALRDSAARLRAIYESEPECVALLADDGTLIEINPAGLAMMEAADASAILGHKVETMVEPAYQDRFRALVARIFAGESGSLLFELIGLAGTRRWMEMNAVPLRNPEGAIVSMLSITRDVTSQHVIEDQLRQAQKMEAVGQLTGGIAHDFNNLLGVIVGNLDLLSLKLARQSTERRLVERAVAAAERGGALTQRLLAFARRQALLPQQLNPGVLVTEVAQLLRRTMGERIELEVAIDPDLWDCYVDPGQLETALVNLAINARDAMPEGGIMTITAGNVRVGGGEPEGRPASPSPGTDTEAERYVVISVADTGQGMDESVRARAFEPFFTTKGVGRGSGLGLSMVYGFVEQSGGYVRLDSAVGCGTSVSLYLKASAAAKPPPPPALARPAARGTGQLVLGVEDDDERRRFAVDALHRLGYRTIPATDGAAAMSALRAHPDIVVLFTDIILPGAIDGFALAARAREERPDIQVLYTSGFADSDKLPPELLAREVELLPKPYRIADLGQRLERLLKQVARPVAE